MLPANSYESMNNQNSQEVGSPCESENLLFYDEQKSTSLQKQLKNIENPQSPLKVQKMEQQFRKRNEGPKKQFSPLKINKKGVKKVKQQFPGETKNIYKNFLRAFRQFIALYSRVRDIDLDELYNIMNNTEMGDGKMKLHLVIDNPQGKSLSKHFFGNLLYTFSSIKLNKIDISQILRFNSHFYLRAIQ